MPKRGVLAYIDGEVTLKGDPPYDMPADMPETFIRKLMTYPKGHDFFIPALARYFTSQARSRLLNTCRSLGGDLWQMYRAEAVKWASLTSDTGQWETDKFFFVYQAELSSPLIDQVGVTDRNIRLVHTQLGWLTFAEFIWRYDETVADHLHAYLAERQREHDALCERIQHIVTAITSDLVLAPLVVAGPGGVEKRAFVGLQAVEKKNWPLPQGLAFLDDDSEKTSC